LRSATPPVRKENDILSLTNKPRTAARLWSDQNLPVSAMDKTQCTEQHLAILNAPFAAQAKALLDSS